MQSQSAAGTPVATNSLSKNSLGTTSAPSTTGALDRIRELESQLADLRSRKDITSLTREEFEILATETAMNLVKTAQQREKSAAAQAAKLIAESTSAASVATATAEAKAKSILAAAEARGRKYLMTAESEGNEAKAAAERTARALADAAKREAESIRSSAANEVEALLTSKKREASAITASAKSEADSMIEQAQSNVADYRSWLVSAVEESERLYKIQSQSLSAAQQAIDQSRQRLAHAFEKLSLHIEDVNDNLDGENLPTAKEFIRAKSGVKESASARPVKKAAVKKAPVKKTQAKKAPVKKAPAKKSAPKKTSSKKAAPKSTRK